MAGRWSPAAWCRATAASGVGLTVATRLAASSRSERQIPNSTRNHIGQWSFDSNIRKSARYEEMRMSEADHLLAAPSALHIILPGEMVADLDDHRDAFRIARPGGGRSVGRRAELPTAFVRKHRDFDSFRPIGLMRLEFGARHRNQFGCGS